MYMNGYSNKKHWQEFYQLFVESCTATVKHVRYLKDIYEKELGVEIEPPVLDFGYDGSLTLDMINVNNEFNIQAKVHPDRSVEWYIEWNDGQPRDTAFSPGGIGYDIPKEVRELFAEPKKDVINKYSKKDEE